MTKPALDARTLRWCAQWHDRWAKRASEEGLTLSAAIHNWAARELDELVRQLKARASKPAKKRGRRK